MFVHAKTYFHTFQAMLNKCILNKITGTWFFYRAVTFKQKFYNDAPFVYILPMTTSIFYWVSYILEKKIHFETIDSHQSNTCMHLEKYDHIHSEVTCRKNIHMLNIYWSYLVSQFIFSKKKNIYIYKELKMFGETGTKVTFT